MTIQINHPSYYQVCTPQTRHIVKLLIGDQFFACECIEVIEILGLNFSEGSLLKYLWRCGDKGGVVADLLKARWYAERLNSQEDWLDRLLKQRRASMVQVIAAIDELLAEYRGDTPTG